VFEIYEMPTVHVILTIVGDETGQEMGDLYFRVLGPVQVFRDGEPVRVVGGTTLTLLAGLLTAPNQIVPVDTLSEWIWDGKTPRHPRAALQNGMSRLRRLVGGDCLSTFAWGYCLTTDADHLDLLEFDHMVSAGADADARGESEAALAAFGKAIKLWQEAPLCNVDSPVLRQEAVPILTERYISAAERWADLCIRLGRSETATAELRGLVRRYPFRESLVGCLMVALASSGSPAEALSVYHAALRALRGELGINPSKELQSLYLDILHECSE
jgi:DNA-binding SARP family transcriptional activator